MSDVKIANEASTYTFLDTENLKSDLRGRSVRGGTATMMGQGANFLIQTFSTVVLARLLLPADFGLIAMVTALTGFANLFKDLGLSMATVQRAEITHEQVNTLFWINVATGALIALISAALAPTISWFYGEPRLLMITVAMSLVFLFGGFTVQHQALMQRQMRFTELAVIQVISMFAGVVAAIVSALMGASYWALVIMQVVSAVIILLGVWLVCNWRPGLPVRQANVRNMLAFGANLTGFNILNYFARNLDNILIGKVWERSNSDSIPKLTVF